MPIGPLALCDAVVSIEAHIMISGLVSIAVGVGAVG